MITTTCKVPIYAVNGKDTPMIDTLQIVVQSVCPLSERVSITAGGVVYEVVRRDLEAALTATAHGGAR